MDIKASDIKALREKTGAGMMECKKALIEAKGDAAGAEKILKEKGLAAVAKRSGRATGEGRIFLKSTDSRVAMVEMTCETDFVANNKDFVAAGEEIVEEILKRGNEEITDDLKKKLEALAIKIRENMSLRRACVVAFTSEESCSTYVHHNNKIGSIVVIKGEKSKNVEDFAHECALHLAANTPSYITREEVPSSYIAEQTEIFEKQMAEDEKMKGKPEAVLKNILQGKISKHLAEICFMDQMFISDEKVSVGNKLKELSKQVGKDLSFSCVKLFVLGK